MSDKTLDYLEISTAERVEYSVIWLHGLGASGHDFEPIVPELRLLQRPGVRFLFPHAPIRPITINGGAAMRGWYDIDSLDFDARSHDRAGIEDSARLVGQLIEQEKAGGVPEENILLAGFSQGGAIALYAGLAGPHRLGGIMALSTYLPLQDQVFIDGIEARAELPIFMAHGRHDDVIALPYAVQSRDAMLQHGLAIEWHDYPIAHSVSAEEVADMATWFKRRFGM